MIYQYYNILRTKIDEGKILDFDELVEDIKSMADKESKYSDLEKFVAGLIQLSSDEEIYNEINGLLEFTSRYGYPQGYPTLTEIYDKLKKLLSLNGEELKNELKKIVDEITNIKEGYGYPAKTEDKKESETNKAEESKFAEETINLFDQEICQVGDYGPKGKVTEQDLRIMLENFNKLKDKLKVPLTVDHAQSGEAFGWVSRLRMVGDKLYADIEHVPMEMADKIRERRYLRYSPEIYITKPVGIDDEVQTPILKCVSLLGVKQPAMKGLKEAEIVFNCENGINYLLYNETEEDVMKEKIENLENELQKLKKEKAEIEIAKFMEDLATQGKIVPAMKETAEKILLDVYDDGKVIQFSEDEKLSTFDAIKKLLTSIPQIVQFNEIKQDAKELDESDPDVKLDRLIEAKRKEIYDKTGRILSYTEAKEIIESQM